MEMHIVNWVYAPALPGMLPSHSLPGLLPEGQLDYLTSACATTCEGP